MAVILYCLHLNITKNEYIDLVLNIGKVFKKHSSGGKIE